MTMAPLVVKGKVLVGNSGGEMGVRGWLTALDENSGKIAGAPTRPAPTDILIGADFKPFYDWMRGKDLGVKTWPPDHWKKRRRHGLGLDLLRSRARPDLLRHGQSRPWNSNQRPGDNLWTTTIFARDPETGRPDGPTRSRRTTSGTMTRSTRVCCSTSDRGRPARSSFISRRDGYMYVIDRATGEVLSADPSTRSTRPRDRPQDRPDDPQRRQGRRARERRERLPGRARCQGLAATAWSPRTKLLYVPHQHLCMN